MIDHQTTINGWKPGQKAVIGRTRVVTIERVTPSGRAVIGSETYKPDGILLGGNIHKSPRLESLTPEIALEMDLERQGRTASNAAIKAIKDAEHFIRQSFSSWGRRVPEVGDVAKAERIAAAIILAMEEPT